MKVKRFTTFLALFLVLFIIISCNTYSSFGEGTARTEATAPRVFSSSSNNSTIIAGFGTENIHIGMSRDELISVLGKPNNEFPTMTSCKYSVLQWYKSYSDGSVEDGDGVFCYLRDNKVFEVAFSSPRFITQNRISYGTKWIELLNVLDKKDFFTLSGSSNAATNYELLDYGINMRSGIAYESGGNALNEKTVNSIYVFSPSDSFHPKGCLGKDQEFTPVY